MYYGSFGAKRPHEALVRLIRMSLDRTTRNPPPETTSRIQFPVAVLFARGDRGGDGDKLAQQAVSSFYYWNDDSGDSIDFIYAGWSENQGELNFDRKDFLAFRAAFEDMCEWKYSGETDLLILNFVLEPSDSSGYFAFDEVIELPIEAMLREKLIGSLDHLAAQIIVSAKEYSARERHENQSPVWVISDKLAMRRGKKDLWDSLLLFVFSDYADKLKGIGHMAVHNFASPGGTLVVELPEQA
jgi:hypothetical protein